MKNTTKKIFSMLLAVVMLLSVMPFGFSAEAKLSVEGEACLDAYARLFRYNELVIYEGGHRPDYIGDFIEETGQQITSRYPGFDMYYEYFNNSATLESIVEITEIMNSAIEEIETYLKEHNFKVVVDPYEAIKYFFGIQVSYNREEFDKICEFEENSEKIDAAFNIINEAFSLIHQQAFNTQAEFDAYWKKACPVLDLMINCLDGIHNYGEYISNGDATEEADGTKTATCEFCGATDTAIDEGSKLDNNDNSKCSCNCHKSGIMAFIWKILNFFYKIFGMNKTCICGVAHY